MIAAKAKEPGQAKAEAPGQKVKQQPVSPQAPAFNPLWQRLALGVQAKLTVSAPDDPFEREADRIAERVMRMPNSGAPGECTACSAGGVICPSCEEKARVQRKPNGVAAAGEVPADFASRLGGGVPLDPESLTFFEPRFGRDFGDVHVHTSSAASNTTRALQAHAFTVGNDIAFASGKWAPNTSDGQRLIAHELAHVAQQSDSSIIQRAPAEGTKVAAEAPVSGPANETTPTAAPAATAVPTPAPVRPYPPFYWGHFAPRGEPVAVARWGATLEDIAEFLYGTPVAALDLASTNRLELSKPLNAGVVVYPTGEALTNKAAQSLASATLLPAGCRDPDIFVQRKKMFDVFLQLDFNSIVAWIENELPLALAGFHRGGAGPLPLIFRKWGEEKFTEYPWAYPNGGDYLDRLFLKLSSKTKILSGILTDEWTNYYSLIFNHFDPDNEIATIRDRYTVVFRGDSGVPEMPSFASMFWEDVKSGKVRDRIFAYGKGLAKGAWSGLKGTAKFVYTVVTDPGQAWEDVKKMPGAVKSLWEHRSELWSKFVNASPEEQAEMIGNLFGQVEFALASGGASSALSKTAAELSQLPGAVGRIAKVADVILSAPSKVLGGAAKVARTVVFKGVEFAVEGATWAARGFLRLGGRVLRGTWSAIEQTVGAVKTTLYYFYDEAAGVLRQIEERIASLFVKCKSPCDLSKETQELARQQLLKEYEEAGKITELPPGPVPTEPPKPAVPTESSKPVAPTEPPKPAELTERPKPAEPTEPPNPPVSSEPAMTAEPTVTLSPEEQRLQELGDELETAKDEINKANQRLKELEKQGKDKFSLEHKEQQKKFIEATDKYVKSKNRLEAEQRAQGISPRQLYERLRGRTPNTEMTRVAASKPSLYGAGASPDHIVPVTDIVEMPGFERLPPDMQIEVLNNVPENTIGLDPRVNSSKGDKLWSAKPGSNRYWEGHADFGPIPPEVRQVMVRAEERARAALQKAIQERLQRLGLL